jgi:hypothetical protein
MQERDSNEGSRCCIAFKENDKKKKKEKIREK